MKYLKIFIVIFLFSLKVYAAPSISGTSGTISDGQSITISGSSFTTGDSTPLIWDTFEGTTNNVINASPEVGTWEVEGDRTKYATSQYHSGAKSGYSIRGAGTTGYYNVRSNGLTSYDKIYTSFWYRFDLNSSTGHLKRNFWSKK